MTTKSKFDPTAYHAAYDQLVDPTDKANLQSLYQIAKKKHTRELLNRKLKHIDQYYNQSKTCHPHSSPPTTTNNKEQLSSKRKLFQRKFISITDLMNQILTPFNDNRIMKLTLEYINSATLLINLSDMAFDTVTSFHNLIKIPVAAGSLAVDFIGFQALTESVNVIYKLYRLWYKLSRAQKANVKTHGINVDFWKQFMLGATRLTLPVALIDSALLGICIAGGVNLFPAAPFLFPLGIAGLAINNFVNLFKQGRDLYRYPITRTPQGWLNFTSKLIKTACFSGIAVSIPIFFFVPGAQAPVGGVIIGLAATLLTVKSVKHITQRVMEHWTTHKMANKLYKHQQAQAKQQLQQDNHDQVEPPSQEGHQAQDLNLSQNNEQTEQDQQSLVEQPDELQQLLEHLKNSEDDNKGNCVPQNPERSEDDSSNDQDGAQLVAENTTDHNNTADITNATEHEEHEKQRHPEKVNNSFDTTQHQSLVRFSKAFFDKINNQDSNQHQARAG